MPKKKHWIMRFALIENIGAISYSWCVLYKRSHPYSTSIQFYFIFIFRTIKIIIKEQLLRYVFNKNICWTSDILWNLIQLCFFFFPNLKLWEFHSFPYIFYGSKHKLFKMRIFYGIQSNFYWSRKYNFSLWWHKDIKNILYLLKSRKFSRY